MTTTRPTRHARPDQAGHRRGRGRTGRRRYLTPVAVAALLAGTLAVFGLSVMGLSRTRAASTPPPSHPPTATASAGLNRSAAMHVRIPAIGVDAGLQALGRNADRRTMQLPPAAAAGWYTQGAAPGQTGPTIIVGYIAGPHGPGVFAHLGALKPGAPIDLRRADGKDVRYAVDQITAYPAKAFPADKVYAPTPQPTLRLITCGGLLHPGAPAGNVVVYAHQVSVRT